jgi:hypothetical protein
VRDVLYHTWFVIKIAYNFAINILQQGRLIGLVTSCKGTAFQNTLLKEREKEG